MAHRLMEFIVGLVFGIGLILAGMTDPAKVKGLSGPGRRLGSLARLCDGRRDPGRHWRLFVARKRTTAFLGGAMHLPTARHIDKRLVVGSLMFGAGWGVAGFCPGPALVSAGAGQPKAIVFVVAMVAGMAIFSGSNPAARLDAANAVLASVFVSTLSHHGTEGPR